MLLPHFVCFKCISTAWWLGTAQYCAWLNPGEKEFCVWTHYKAKKKLDVAISRWAPLGERGRGEGVG